MDNFFEAHGEFITLEMTDRINADSLISVIKDVLKDHSLSVSKLRGLIEAKLPSLQCNKICCHYKFEVG